MENTKDADCVIVGGHSLWFKEFFKAFLPRRSDHVAKKKKVRLLPIRPRSRGARRSLRTFPVVTLHPRFPFNVHLTGKTFDRPIASPAQIVNCGCVGFTLQAGRDDDGRVAYRIDPKSVDVIYGGFAK